MGTVPPRGHMRVTPILPFNERQAPAIRLYPLSNYTFGTKETQLEEDPSVKDRLKRLEEHYEKHGMRRSCEGVLICHEHNHPHVLMLQIANAFFKLPGDYLPHDADEIEGFKARLNERLAPTGSLSNAEGADPDWNVIDTLAQWYRPNFEPPMYPYLPTHVTRPKECKKLYFIQLPKAKVLSVPKNMKLLAVPLFELYDNSQRYGPQLSAIPHYLSRYRWEFVDEQDEVVSFTPGGPVDARVKTKILAGGENGVDADMSGLDKSPSFRRPRIPMVHDYEATRSVFLEEFGSSRLLAQGTVHNNITRPEMKSLQADKIHHGSVKLRSKDRVQETSRALQGRSYTLTIKRRN